MANTVKAWSYSAYAMYEQCPAKYKYEKIDKLPSPKSAAMERGNRVHKTLETFLMRPDIKEPPREAGDFSTELVDLKNMQPFVEQKWGFKKDWGSTTFFSKDVWLRSILDAGVIYPDNTATIIDFKTGKLYETNEDQVELFSLTVMARYPQIKSVDTRLWYVDSGDEVAREYNSSQKASLKKKWEKKVYPLFNDVKFPPKPNRFCGWCHFRRDNGGPCKF